MKKRIGIAFLVVLLISSQTAYADYADTAELFARNISLTQRWGSPIVTGEGYSAWSLINSKWSEVRDVTSSDTTPHCGIDITKTAGIRVVAVENGWLTKFNDNMNTVSLSTSVANVYCHYEHMYDEDVAPLVAGYYAKGDQIGIMGSAPWYTEGKIHLHFAAYSLNQMSGRLAYENSTLYANSSAWEYGQRTDVYSNVQWTGGEAVITAVFSEPNNNHNEHPMEVRIFHRQAGAVAWIDGGNMNNISGTFDYTYDFSNIYESGTNIEWMVRIKRDTSWFTNSGTDYPYVWAPAKYYRPPENPNATSLPYGYYSNQV